MKKVGLDKFTEILTTTPVIVRKKDRKKEEEFKKLKKWIDAILRRPEVLGVVAWVSYKEMKECELLPTYESPQFAIYIKDYPEEIGDKVMKAKNTTERNRILTRFYSNRAVKRKIPFEGNIVWVEKVDRMPKFTKDDIEAITVGGYEESFAIFKKKK